LQDASVVADDVDPGQHGDRPWQVGFAGRGQAHLQHVGLELVVVVQEGDPASPGRRHGQVPGCAGPAPLRLPEDTDAAVALEPDRLGRAVVHDQDLEVRDGLGQGAGDGPHHQSGPVVGRDDDADLGVGHSRSSGHGAPTSPVTG
jgi:hypothetical protein